MRSRRGGALPTSKFQGKTVNPDVVRATIPLRLGSGASEQVNASVVVPPRMEPRSSEWDELRFHSEGRRAGGHRARTQSER